MHLLVQIRAVSRQLSAFVILITVVWLTGCSGAKAISSESSLSTDPTRSPSITSVSSATFAVGTAGTFTVTATGTPTPTLTESGNLPNGVTFNAATGSLTGTPAAGTSGSYSITFTAHNGVGADATQNFALIVSAVSIAPAITSPASTTFTVGTPASFSVTTTGAPPPTVSESGILPAGVSFDASNGVLSGTPASGSAGTYPIVLTAHNGVGSDAIQNFTLTVTPQTTQTLSLVQHTSVSSSQSLLPSSYQLNFQPTLAGNALVFCFSASDGAGVTATSIFDSSGTTSYKFAVPPPGFSDGNSFSNCAYALNIPQGITSATVALVGGPPDNLQATVSEFAGVATAGAGDGSSAQSGTGAIVTAGTFTPTTSGDLIYNFVVEDTGGPASTNAFTTGPAPWTMLSADIQDNIAAQFEIQTAAAPVNATMTQSPANNGWASIAFALKSAPAGTPAPSGIRVLRVQHEDPLENGSFQTQMPCSGNLIIGSWLSGLGVDIVDTSVAASVAPGAQTVAPDSMAGITDGAVLGIDVGSNYEVVTVSGLTGTTFTANFAKAHAGTWAVSGITDNQLNAWQSADGIVSNDQGGDGQIFFAPSARCSATGATLLINVVFGGSNPGSTLILSDVTGAAAAPLDRAAKIAGDNETDTAVTGVTITPSTSNGLIVSELGVDNNSVIGVGTGLFLSIIPGPFALDYPADENNGWMMFYNPSTAPITPVWTTNAIPNFWVSMSAAFKAAN